MKNIILVKNFDPSNKVDKHLTMSEYGFLYYLSINNIEKNLYNLLEDLEIDIFEFKHILEKLQLKKILELKIYIKEQDSIIWEIKFVDDNKNSFTKSDYSKLFILTDEQISSLNTLTDSREVFLRLLKIYKSTLDKYNIDNISAINSEEDYKRYLEISKPFTIFYNNQVEPSTKEISLMYEVVCIKNIDVPMINFLIDYTISTSVYKNFSIEYFLKVLKNWQSNNIDNLVDAMEYVKSKKKEIQNKSSKYEEPSWQEEDVSIIADDLTEIEELLKENKIN